MTKLIWICSILVSSEFFLPHFRSTLKSAWKTVSDALRIIGGQVARQGQFPYLVSLQLDGQHFCGGSIYDEFNVVTAAHCCEEAEIRKARKFEAIGGELNLKNRSGLEQTVQVNNISIHPDWIMNEDPRVHFANDICVLHLSNDGFSFNDNVKTVRLSTKVPATGSKCSIAGWGFKKVRFSAISLVMFDYCVCIGTWQSLRWFDVAGASGFGGFWLRPLRP